jgi:hypothetical protein
MKQGTKRARNAKRTRTTTGETKATTKATKGKGSAESVRSRPAARGEGVGPSTY